MSISTAIAAPGDADNDGIADQFECKSLGTSKPRCPDADGDGRPDYLDRDSDGDRVPDVVDGANDSDNDGSPNYLDPDDDNDGIPTSWEQLGDIDDDGLPNYLDIDSDNDGLLDGVEGTGDVDKNGVANYLDTDSDGDGINDDNEGMADSDRDGIANYVDNEFNPLIADPVIAESGDGHAVPVSHDSDGEAATLLAGHNNALGHVCRDDQECATGKCEGNQCVCSTNNDCPAVPGFGNAEPFCVKAAFKRNGCILRCETDSDCPAETPSCSTKFGTRYRRCR